MPLIESFSTMQSTVLDWQKRGVRGKADFPKFVPKYQTSDYFSYKYPNTVNYRGTLSPAQMYSSVSRQKYMDHLNTALAHLPSDKTLQVRWTLSKDKPTFSMDFLKMFLSRKYGNVEAIYQQAVNSCLVVFKRAESAFAVGRDPHPGQPHGRLHVRQWQPQPQDNSYFKVMKHIEKAADTKSRFYLMMDHVDRETVMSQEQGYCRALTCRNKMYGPSMLPVLTHEKGLGDIFNTVPPKLSKKRAKSRSQSIAVASKSASSSSSIPEIKTLVKEIENHEEFLKLLWVTPITLVKFFATWCGPCKLVGPHVDKLSLGAPDITFVAVDVDENPDTAEKCHVNMLPTFQFYIRGRMVDELRGNSVALLKDKIFVIREVLEESS